MNGDHELPLSDDPGNAEMTPIEERSEGVDIHEMHSGILREHEEPEDGHEPVPFWMLVVFGGLLFWGGFYLAAYHGDWERDRFDYLEGTVDSGVPSGELIADTPEKLALVGKGIYSAHCARCHQDDGKGVAGKIPPLVASNRVLSDDTANLSRVVLFGLTGKLTIGGTTYEGECPALGMQLPDRSVASVLTYIRQEWGNKSSAIVPDSIKELRKPPPSK